MQKDNKMEAKLIEFEIGSSVSFLHFVFTRQAKYPWGSSQSDVATVIKFELQSRHYVHFRTNIP